MCNILCRSCTCSVKYGYSINSTSEYRNTVDFHSQRLAIIEFSRQEFGKPRPGKTHKTMFYNILAPTISVKYLKNKRKVQFSSSKRYLATESVLFYILCKMPTNIFLYDEKEIFCFFPFILSPVLSTILTAHIRLPGYLSPQVCEYLAPEIHKSILPSILPVSLHASFLFVLLSLFLPISAGIAVRTILLLSHGGAFLVFYVRPPVKLFAFGRLFSFKCPAFFISLIHSSGGKQRMLN